MKCDIAVVGGGVLGVTTAYWDGLGEKERDALKDMVPGT